MLSSSAVSAVAPSALLFGWLKLAASFVGFKTCMANEGRHLSSVQFTVWTGSDVLPDVHITMCLSTVTSAQPSLLVFVSV